MSSLEKQIETLTAALQGATPTASLASPTSQDTPTSRSRAAPELERPFSDPQGINTDALAQPSTPPRDNVPPAIYGLTWAQADRILLLFREKFICNFPFLVLNEGITAQRLFAEKPFSFRVIMLAAAPLPIPRMIKMKRNVLAYLGQHMLVEEERQLDLLQGLLICISW